MVDETPTPARPSDGDILAVWLSQPPPGVVRHVVFTPHGRQFVALEWGEGDAQDASPRTEIAAPTLAVLVSLLWNRSVRDMLN